MRIAEAPTTVPDGPVSGTQCASTHVPDPISALKVTSPPSARVRYWGSAMASSTGTSSWMLRPRTAAHSRPVRRSMAAFQWTTVRPASTTTSAPRKVSMRLIKRSPPGCALSAPAGLGSGAERDHRPPSAAHVSRRARRIQAL
jgi:hypothetical protein